MKQTLFTRWRKSAGDAPDERLDAVSPDLPFELQSKVFDQLATVSIAGAGLTVTLIGSLLHDASRIVWLSVVCFALAALTALDSNIRLIDGLFRRRSVLGRSKRDVQLAMALIGMAIGILSMTVYAAGERSPDKAVAAKPTQ